MVRKDLERVGIPYKDEDGCVADFHAAGRHTHITELLRNGASLVEAQKLARHSDVKMTMKYTHIGIDDQAEALEKLPSLQMRCISCSADGRKMSLDVSGESVLRAVRKRSAGRAKSGAPGQDRGHGCGGFRPKASKTR